MSAKLRFEQDLEPPHGFQLKLDSGFFDVSDASLVVQWTHTGQLTLALIRPNRESVQATGQVTCAPAATHHLEARREGTALSVRLWPAGSIRPTEPTVQLQLPADLPEARFFGLRAPQFIGSRLEVDEVGVRSF